MLNIVIFGAPGSGKGTQSARIVEKYGLNHISTGDVLRAEIKNGTELGKTAKGYIDNGQLIPDALMIDILASVFDSFKDSKGVIFDGFPRTIAQAEALKEMLKVRGQEVSIMLDLEVPEDELMTRLIKRGQESGRADDNEETIKKRLVVYHSQTAPLIDFYEKIPMQLTKNFSIKNALKFRHQMKFAPLFSTSWRRPPRRFSLSGPNLSRLSTKSGLSTSLLWQSRAGNPCKTSYLKASTPQAG